MYNRRYRHANTWKDQLVVDPLFKEWYQEGKPLDAFVGAYDISPQEHIEVQATTQKYIDSCISKTINLPSTVEATDLSQEALDYAPYLKGLTVYRAGSKGNEPLEAIPLTNENTSKYMEEECHEEKVESGEVCSLVGGGCSE